MAYELIYLPGRFSDGVAGFVGPLVGGRTAVRLRSMCPAIGPGADARRTDPPEASAAWLVDVGEGELRTCIASFDAFGRRANGSVSSRGVRGGRALVHFGIPGDGPLQPSDAETALLAVSCGALAKESQGAVLIGYDLGDPAEYGVEGSVAEQVRAAAAGLGGKILLVVAAADTASALGELDGFYAKPFSNLTEYRRTTAL